MEFLLASEFVLTDRSFEFPDSDTQTEPDGSMSIREILSRFAKGTLPPVVKYEGGYDTDDPDDMDVDPTLAPDFDLTDGDRLSAEIEARKSAQALLKDVNKSFKDEAHEGINQSSGASSGADPDNHQDIDGK